MPLVFICYRRDDSAASAGRIFDRLEDRFGTDNVFRDLDTIEPGLEFAKVIAEHIAKCDVFIAVIGKGWLHAREEQGQRRLDDPKDYVKAEIRESLRLNKLIIPVLVEGAVMPKDTELPRDIAALAGRNAIEISESRFDYDVDLLIKAVDPKAVTGTSKAKHIRKLQKTRIGAASLMIGAIIAFLSKNTSVIDWVERRFFSSPDLTVSSLNVPDRLLRLPGHPIIQQNSQGPPVFAGGCRAKFSLAHNRKGEEPIKVTSISVKVDQFLPIAMPEYKYRVNLDELFGRGQAEARVYKVTLSGTEVSKAVWVEKNPLTANSANLLDVNPPRILSLESGHDIGEEIDITVTPNKLGFYKVHFAFQYFVSGKDHMQISNPVSLYYNE